jgi:endonuclease/exonuclease/phosphatase family metal-dependent hydrolase
MRFTVATYNIHKGFTQLNRRMVIHELRDRLHGCPPTSCCCRRS